MAKQTLGQGDSNVVVRNQVVYGALPQDVIDRMGDTTLALQTTEQNVLPAINELKSNLTDLTTPSPLGQDLSSHLNAGWSVAEYIRYSKIGAIVIVDIGGLSKASTGPEAVINGNNNYLPNAITRPLGVVTSDSSNDSCLLYGSIGDTGITMASHRSNVRYYGEIIYLTDE